MEIRSSFGLDDADNSACQCTGRCGISYGSGSLKALQNDNLPEIDLLVREAIQNSSDASLREPGDSFGVSFSSFPSIVTLCPR